MQHHTPNHNNLNGSPRRDLQPLFDNNAPITFPPKVLDAIIKQIITINELWLAKREFSEGNLRQLRQGTASPFVGNEQELHICAREVFSRQNFRIDQVPAVFIAAHNRIPEFELANPKYRGWTFGDGTTIGTMLTRIFFVWFHRVNYFVWKSTSTDIFNLTSVFNFNYHRRQESDLSVKIPISQLASIVEIVAATEFSKKTPSTYIADYIMTPLFKQFRIDRTVEVQMYTCIAAAAFSGKISFDMLSYAISQRSFILYHPVPRFLLQAALLGPFTPMTAMRFVIFVREKPQLATGHWSSFKTELEALVHKVQTWQYNPAEFEKGVQEYAKRELKDVPSFGRFWANFSNIIQLLVSKRLIDLAPFNPNREMRNYAIQQGPTRNSRNHRQSRQWNMNNDSTDTDEEPEFTSMRPVNVQLDPVVLEYLAKEQEKQRLAQQNAQVQSSSAYSSSYAPPGEDMWEWRDRRMANQQQDGNNPSRFFFTDSGGMGRIRFRG